MTRTLVRLKLRLLRNGLRRSVWQLVGLVIGIVYGLGFVAMAVVGLIAMRWLEPQLAHLVTMLVFSIVTIGWIVLPMFLHGADNTVDPSRFALFGVRAGELLPGLLLGGLIGIPGVCTVLISLSLVGTWSTGVLPVLAALVAALAGSVLCVLWSRTVLTWLSALLRRRRVRDIAVVAFLVLILGGSLGLQSITRLGELSADHLLGMLTTAGTVLGWTPFGWVWGLPGAVALGAWPEAAVRLLLTAALTAGLVLLWRARLAIELTSPLDAGDSAGTMKADSWTDRLVPPTPAGAIAGRGFRYWRRDPRYQVGAVALLLLPVFMVAVVLINDGGLGLAVWAPILISMMGGSSMVSDTSYDNSAFGLHVLSGVAGRDDRWGRVLTYLWILVPMVLLMTILAAVVSGAWVHVPSALAVSTVVLLAGLGAGAVVGVYLPGKVAEPGASAFAASNSGNLQSMLGLGLVWLLTAAVSLPTIGLVVGSLVGPDWLGWIALPVAVVCGAAALVAGVRIGGKQLDRRGPELLASVST